MNTATLPDAEELLAALAGRMRAEAGPDTALIGIHTGGVWLAERLHGLLGLVQPLGSIDVSFYRDDFGSRGLSPRVKPSDIPFDVEGADVILVDDVLYTGRTIRAALNELFDYGRPRRVRRLAEQHGAALVDVRHEARVHMRFALPVTSRVAFTAAVDEAAQGRVGWVRDSSIASP